MSGTLFYSFTNENTMSAWLDPVKAYIGLGGTGIGPGSSLLQNPQQLSTLIAQMGRGGTLQAVTASYASQTAPVTLNTSYKYLAVWIAGTTMSSPVFLPVSGTTTGGSTGGGSYPWLSNNGFSVQPTRSYLGNEITFTAATTSVVQYIFTNQTNSITTANEFTQLYNIASVTDPNSVGHDFAMANVSASIKIPSYGSYKYVYILLASATSSGSNYTPVCVQLS